METSLSHEVVFLDAPTLTAILGAIAQDIRLDLNGWLVATSDPTMLPLWNTYHRLVQFLQAHPGATQFILTIAPHEQEE